MTSDTAISDMGAVLPIPQAVIEKHQRHERCRTVLTEALDVLKSVAAQDADGARRQNGARFNRAVLKLAARYRVQASALRQIDLLEWPLLRLAGQVPASFFVAPFRRRSHRLLRERESGMRQIAADGMHYFHDTLDERVVYQQVGFVWQWRILLHAWDRLQRFQMIDNDEGFCAVAEVIRGTRRERFYVEDVVVASRDGLAETALFVHPASLADLLAGCQELRDMMNSDAAGTFLGYQTTPLLEPDEEYFSRRLIEHVLTVDQNRIVPFRRRFRGTA